MLAAAAAGCDGLGENYAQELAAKVHELADAADHVRWHFLGRLQTNKVRRLADAVAVWESVDRPALIDELVHRAPGTTVLVQVAATGEEHKGGCRPDDVAGLVDRARDGGLAVAGLMTVGPTEGGAEAARPAFRLVRELSDELGLAVRSMGMSADLEVAVEEGSTQVRLGTALFGARQSAPG